MSYYCGMCSSMVKSCCHGTRFDVATSKGTTMSEPSVWDELEEKNQGWEGVLVSRRRAEEYVAKGRELEAALAQARAEIETLKARKRSHGDYRMVGTTDCANPDCEGYGRTEFYVVGEGLCVGCQNVREAKRRAGTGEKDAN